MTDQGYEDCTHVTLMKEADPELERLLREEEAIDAGFNNIEHTDPAWMREHISSLKNTISALEHGAKVRDQQITSLRADNAKLDDDCLSYANEASEYRTQITGLQSRVFQLADKVRDVENSLTTANERIMKLACHLADNV